MKLSISSLMLWLILLGLFLLVSIGSIYWLLSHPEESVRVIEMPVGCDLNKTDCRMVIDDDQWVKLAINERPIQVMTPLKIHLTLGAIEPSKLRIEFKGISMNMGLNMFEFKPVVKGYEAIAMLPICSAQTMDWQAQVHMVINQEVFVVNYYFTTFPP